jgi:hypothetical protein
MGEAPAGVAPTYASAGRGNTYAQAKATNPGLDDELERRRQAIGVPMRDNPCKFKPEGYKDLEFIYEVTRDGANPEYRINMGDDDLMNNGSRLKNLLLKAGKFLGNDKSRSRDQQRGALRAHLTDITRIENAASVAIRDFRANYTAIGTNGGLTLIEKLRQKAEVVTNAANAIGGQARAVLALGGNVTGDGVSHKTVEALNSNRIALHALLDQLSLLTMVVAGDLRQNSEVLQQNSDNIRGLEAGLVELYKSVVKLVYLRADLLPAKNVGGRSYKDTFTEYMEAGIDAILAGLPSSVQFAMYQSFDDAFARRELGTDINDLRYAIPGGVRINPDGMVTFPDDYNVDNHGIPADGVRDDDGNPVLIPIPPAFVPHH